MGTKNIPGIPSSVSSIGMLFPLRQAAVIGCFALFSTSAASVYGAERPDDANGVPSTRPNVLFFIIDDLNTHVSTSGHEQIKTPSLDRLAAAGMNFTRAYAQFPVCGPSRASFLSGLYPESTGVTYNTLDMRDTRPGTLSLPQVFKEAGYWTASVGKVFHNMRFDHGDTAWSENAGRFSNDPMPVEIEAREKFLAEHGPITRQNREKWEDFQWNYATQLRNQHVGYGPSGLTDEQHKDGKNAAQIIQWLEGRAGEDQPFFIAAGIQKPHVPFLAPDKYFDLYPQDGLVLEPVDKVFWDQAPRMASIGRYRQFGFEFLVENDALRREYVQAYYATVTFIDAQIGKIIDALRRTGQAENTIIVLTSDHGFMLGEKFMWGKPMLFEQCAVVPLLIRVPEKVAKGATTPGSESSELVELIDLFPTLMELAGLQGPANLQGMSLVPLLQEPVTAKGKEAAYTVVNRGNDRLGKSVRTQRWRYNRWPDGTEELYDLANDSRGTVNQVHSDQHQDALKKMRNLLTETEQRAASQRRNSL